MTVAITHQTSEALARSFDLSFFTRAYGQGCNVSQLLEQEDPTSELPENERELDAFERVMEAAGIIAAPIAHEGVRATTWGDATKTRQGRAIMHEFCARVWRQATKMAPMTETTRALLLSGDAAVNTIANQYADDNQVRAKRLLPPIPLDSLLARRTQIDGQDYRSIYIVDDLGTDAYRLKRVMEGTRIPATTLVTGEHVLQIHKFGRILRATYEQLRRQRIDRIAFIISRMAMQAEVDKVAIVLDTVLNGDGNANTSSTVVTQTALDPGSSAGTLTLRAWLSWKMSFTNAYRLDVVLAQSPSLMQLLLLPVNTVNGTPLVMLPQGGLGSMRNMGNRFDEPIGYGELADAPALKLVGWDSNQTVEEVSEIGGNVSEVDRFIEDQTQAMSMTEVVGYGIVDANGSKTLNING
ncbi:MAG TPA: hypothetical protein VF723_07310 [Pyrinomonadaceae bacterium]|jgi:hypothetical protein